MSREKISYFKVCSHVAYFFEGGDCLLPKVNSHLYVSAINNAPHSILSEKLMSLAFSARVKGVRVGLCYRCVALGPTSGHASVSPTCSLRIIAHYLICRFQVLRLLWRTPRFPRVQAKASQYRSAPRRLHSHGHL